MATDIIIAPDTNTGQSILIVDSTDYPTLGISISDINAVRYLFATYSSILNKSAVAKVLANYEYVVTSGSFVLNGTTYTDGDVFMPYEDFTLPTTGVTVEQTGYYSPLITTIPSANVDTSFTPSQVGENSTYFQDNFRKVRYEIYKTVILAGGAVGNSTYKVQGTQNASITLSSGQKYYVGQVFAPSGVVSFTASGNAYAVEYFDTGSFDFWTDYNAIQVYKTYQIALANSNYNLSEDFRANFIKTVSQLGMPYVYSNTGETYSEEEIQNALDYINTVLSKTIKDIRNA
jgi:hypothetical protein